MKELENTLYHEKINVGEELKLVERDGKLILRHEYSSLPDFAIYSHEVEISDPLLRFLSGLTPDTVKEGAIYEEKHGLLDKVEIINKNGEVILRHYYFLLPDAAQHCHKIKISSGLLQFLKNYKKQPQ